MAASTKHTCDFDKHPVLKALQSSAYELNNLKCVRTPMRGDQSDQMLMAVNHGFDLTLIQCPMALIKHCRINSDIFNNDAVRTHKLPFDSIERITFFEWVSIQDGSLWFLIGTESGKIHFYDAFGIKELSMTDCLRKDTDSVCPASVLCIGNRSTFENRVLVGLSNGKVVSIPVKTERRKSGDLRVDSAVSTLFKASSSITTLWIDDSRKQIWVGTGKGTVIRVLQNDQGECNVECAMKSKHSRDGVTCLMVCQSFVIIGTELGFLKIISSDLSSTIGVPSSSLSSGAHASGVSAHCSSLPISAMDVCIASDPPGSIWIVVASEEGKVICFHLRGSILQSSSLVCHSQFRLQNCMICGIRFALKPFVNDQTGMIEQNVLRKWDQISSDVEHSGSEIEMIGNQSVIQSCNQHMIALTAYDRNGFLLLPGPKILLQNSHSLSPNKR